MFTVKNQRKALDKETWIVCCKQKLFNILLCYIRSIRTLKSSVVCDLFEKLFVDLVKEKNTNLAAKSLGTN